MSTVSLASDFAPWQGRIARGEPVVARWKDEGDAGPFVLEATDEAAADPLVRPMRGGVTAQPFGYRPSWRYSTADRGVWVTRADARRFAKALGLVLEES